MSRKICVVTGSRAEYGLLRWIMEEIGESTEFELQIIATGMHLSPEFGSTFSEIEKDGFRIDEKIEMLISSDTSIGITKSIGVGTIGFADAYARLNPDVVVILGDRFEILAAAQAAFIAGICIAHISGGEVTEGALDDSIRHCITKMSRYHFAATETYRRRVIQLGEQPNYVFNVGDPGLDNIERLHLLDREEFYQSIGIRPGMPFLLVTYHPTTSGDADPVREMDALLGALEHFPNYAVLLTKANADAGGRVINAMADEYALNNSHRVWVTTSMGQLKYLSAMRHCAAVIGNSSSGIVEAPAMGKSTVNIGTRQAGRLRADSIIDCSDNRDAIVNAIRKAISAEFGERSSRTVSLYGNCAASSLIVKKLGEANISRRFSKQFYDLPY
jgi:UDP-hydrolysing UDP-N-acetyl-D-glucosamine 2-epimerase